MPTTNGQPHHASDDEYKKSTKEVVDDMLRDDVLGPRLCTVLTNHTPASEKIKLIVSEAIVKEPALRTAIEDVVNGLDTKRKGRLMDKLTGAFWTLVAGIVLAAAIYFLKLI